MTPSTVLLVVAKAPVPGHAKTRLTPPATAEQAAEIAAASLLDTLDAVLATPGTASAVAWAGDVDAARRQDELATALAQVAVLAQRGPDFAARLASAHVDAGRMLPGRPVLQIGMDTPQITADLLAASAEPLHRVGGPDAVLGPASDGGWWALGVREPLFAEALRGVPMSRSDTDARTLRALRTAGFRVELLSELSDVDTLCDARRVAQRVPGSRFASAVATVTARSGDRQ